MPTSLAQPLLGPFRQGARNDGVRVIQERLNELLGGTPGFVRLTADGAFGAKTASAVVRFQEARKLRADGVVGPITANALGFTHYTSLQRVGAGAMQLASTITGSLARLVPTPHSDPNPAYDILLALAVHADAMRTVLRAFPAAASTKHEIERIVASLQHQLENLRRPAFLVGAVQGMTDAMQVQGRLYALSRQLHAIAHRQSGLPAQAPQAGVLEMLAVLSESMAGLAGVVMAFEGLTLQRQLQAANRALQIAARVSQTAKRLLPSF